MNEIKLNNKDNNRTEATKNVDIDNERNNNEINKNFESANQIESDDSNVIYLSGRMTAPVSVLMT